METGPAEILLIRPPPPAHERALAAPDPEQRRPEARPGPGGQRAPPAKAANEPGQRRSRDFRVI